MKNVKKKLTAAFLAIGLFSVAATAYATSYYVDDQTSGGWSDSGNLSIKSGGNASNGSYHFTWVDTSGSGYGRWFVTTVDNPGITGEWFAWKTFIPNDSGILHDKARYFKDGALINKIDQNAYKNSYVQLDGAIWMADSTTYRYSADNYRPDADNRIMVWDQTNLED